MIKKDRLDARRWVIAIAMGIILVGSYFAYPWLRTRLGRMRRLREWLHDPTAHPEWMARAGDACGDAPFILPTSGYVGFVWGDSFRPGKAHQGVDIFGGDEPGKTPVIAAHRGYLTRLPDWKSTIIIRVPADPLDHSRQIWTYYTHMANQIGTSYISSQFPPGTSEVFVEAGTFLGYQGDYSGDPGNPVGVHLHFSIVLDNGQGSFCNELKVGNTLDPTPYLGFSLNARQNPNRVVTCTAQNGN